MAKPPRIYWDACTWIAYISQETDIDVGDGVKENRFASCREVLQRAENNDLEIVTSTFTLAEVCKDHRVRTSPLDNLPAFFLRPYIFTVNVDMSIGQRAQHMQASGLVGGLKPVDTVHLASAIRAKVYEFHTYDQRILNLDGRIVGDDGNPIKICKPLEGTPLPLFEETGESKPADS